MLYLNDPHRVCQTFIATGARCSDPLTCYLLPEASVVLSLVHHPKTGHAISDWIHSFCSCSIPGFRRVARNHPLWNHTI
jgi:hypothetical protein